MLYNVHLLICHMEGFLPMCLERRCPKVALNPADEGRMESRSPCRCQPRLMDIIPIIQSYSQVVYLEYVAVDS